MVSGNSQLNYRQLYIQIRKELISGNKVSSRCQRRGAAGRADQRTHPSLRTAMLRIARRAASRASWSGEGSMAIRGWTTGATAKAERDLAEARASLRTSRAAWTRVDMSPPESLRARSCTRACFLRSPRHRSSPPGLGLRLGLGLGPALGLGLGSGFGAGLGLGFWHISFSPPPPPLPLLSSPLYLVLS